MEKTIQLLDCTLRDGGLGLEDSFKNNISDVGFSETDKMEMADCLSDAAIDIIELGSIELSDHDKTRFAIYQDVESISRKIPSKHSKNSLFVGLYRGPDTPIEDIPEHNSDLVDGLRVIIRYSELKKSIEFCAALAQKGYKVFVQPMLTMRYTKEEISYLIDAANDMGAYALYFVDSYGYMDEEDVRHFFTVYDAGLGKDIRIGFHAHNNMNLAYANVKSFINEKKDRKIVIDSCITGMGQGAGNLQTELIVPYLNQKWGKTYHYDAVLAACEVLDHYQSSNLWGYSVTRLLPAIYKTAYKYAISFRKQYRLSYVEIRKILESIPEEFRHRYTPENAKKLLELYQASNEKSL
ncbi:MAG: hypothetical protein LIO99_13670 [Clostridiales bacterium]|nr:hypothetical protein [Clostridiales bacterium]MCC8107025.1 hypothetical protein [Clostridiales bacterium]